MNDFVDSFAYWLADFGLTNTVLLTVALVALTLMEQPAKRLAVVKGAMLAIALLAGLCAVPGWSLVNLATSLTAQEHPPSDATVVNVGPPAITPTDALEFSLPIAANPATLPVAEAAPRISWSWRSIALVAYSLGSGATFLWLTVGWASAYRLLRDARPVPSEFEDLLSTVLAVAPSRPQLRVSSRIDVAAALGVWRPTVLLPSSWVTGRGTNDLRAVLAHECAHVRNGDLKWLALSRVLNVALWMHPLYLLLRRRMRLEQESLADAAAAELSSRTTYAEQLVAWARTVPLRSRPALASAVGLWESPSQLRRRVALLLDERFAVLRECSRRLRRTTLVAFGLVALLLSAFTLRPTLSAPAEESTLPDHVVEGDRYVLCRVTTDLQRSLLGNAAQPVADASACLIVNAATFAEEPHDQGSPVLKELSTRLATWAQVDDRRLVVQVYVAPSSGDKEFTERKDFAETLSRHLERLASAVGYERVSSSRVHAGDFDWGKFVGKAESLAKPVSTDAEQTVGDERVEVFAVQTFLSRMLVNADCVVNILPIIQQPEAQDFPSQFQESMNEFVPQLKYDQSDTMLLRVQCTDSAEGRLMNWIEDRLGKNRFAAEISFKTCNLSMSYVAESDAGPKREDITGRIVRPDGSPAAGVSVMAYSMVDPDKLSLPHGFERGTTDVEGRFRLSLYSGGKEVLWILPDDYVPQTHVINDRRGDLGNFELTTGLYFHGSVVDEHSQPIPNVWVNAELVAGAAKQRIDMPVADHIQRSSLTDSDGHFDLGPLPSGTFRLGPDELPAEKPGDQNRRPLPAAYLPQRLDLSAASELEELEIKPVESVRIEVHFVDSSGKPVRGNGFFLIGTGPDGHRVALQRRQQGQETVSFVAPKGLTGTIIDFPRSSMRVRRAPDEPWENDWSLDLGTLDRDWREIEAVRYRTPTVAVTAKDEDGKSIADFKPALFYHASDQPGSRTVRRIGEFRGDVNFERQTAGGWQSQHLLPDEVFTLTVTADGYEPFEFTQSIPEGERKTVDAELRRIRQADAGGAAEEADATGEKTNANLESTQHAVVGGGAVNVFVAGNPATPWDYRPNVLAIAVQDEVGKPIEGIEAIVIHTSPKPGERVVVPRAMTNAEGKVEFDGLVDSKRAAALQELEEMSQFPLTQGDIFYVVLRKEGRATVILAASDFTLAGRGVKRSVRMRPAVELSGRVTDWEGKPVVGATVAAGGIAGTFMLEGSNAVKTNADGRYRFRDRVAFNREAANKRIAEQNQWTLGADRDLSKIYPAVYDPAEDSSVSDLYVTHPDYAVTTVQGGDVPGTTDVVMLPAAAIEGRVIEFGSEEPVANVMVKTVGQVASAESSELFHTAGNAQSTIGSLHSAMTRTDAEGRYRLSNLPAGRYDVYAQAPENDIATTDWVCRGINDLVTDAKTSPTSAPDLVVGLGATIRGELVDAATGKPLSVGEPAVVQAVGMFVGGPNQQTVPLQRVSATVDGKFEIRAYPGKLRVYLMVQQSEEDGRPLITYRSTDDAMQSGRVFDMKHGESVEAEFQVWSNANLEALRQKIQAGYEAQASGDPASAVALFGDALEMDPESGSALAARAGALEKLGRDREALADYDAVGKLTSMDPFGYWRMADLLATSNEPEVRDGRRAVEVATKVLDAIRRQPPSVENEVNALALLAAAQAEAGDFEAAAATQREAIEKSPEQRRGEFRERLKLYEAGKAYRREGQR
jgi:beta-lactamase regulating signal transducer with metallopeptidase domain